MSRTTSTPVNGGTIIEKLKGSVRPPSRCISPSSTRSISLLVIPSIPSRSKNLPTISEELPTPPRPKWPRNGSAVTKVTGATSSSPAFLIRCLTLKRNS